jgi:hypothetical protein
MGIFQQFGAVESITMLQSRSSSGDGCVLVKFEDCNAAEAALILNGKSIIEDTRPIEVRYAEAPVLHMVHTPYTTRWATLTP